MTNPERHLPEAELEPLSGPQTMEAPKPAPIENKDPLKLSNVPSEYTLMPSDPDGELGYQDYAADVKAADERRWSETPESKLGQLGRLEQSAAELARCIVADDAIEVTHDPADMTELHRLAGEMIELDPELEGQTAEAIVENLLDQEVLNHVFGTKGS